MGPLSSHLFRFGKGIYTSSTSSKSDGYSSNGASSPLKAMLLNKVIVGRGHKVPNFQSFSSPPSGYDSVCLLFIDITSSFLKLTIIKDTWGTRQWRMHSLHRRCHQTCLPRHVLELGSLFHVQCNVMSFDVVFQQELIIFIIIRDNLALQLPPLRRDWSRCTPNYQHKPKYCIGV